MSKKDKSASDAQDFSGAPPVPVTAADIQQKEFRVSRFGGYRMRDVDEFLDQVTEAMTKLADENQRLRSASGLPPTSIGAPDVAGQSRQADEIVARARAEAAQILQEARATAGSTTDGAAVSALLSQERSFLQQLASLVQGHAEAVKAMAKASRTAAPTSTAPPSVGEPSRDERATEKPEGPAAAAPDEGRPEASAPSTVSETAETQPIRIQDPAPASVAGGDRVDEGSAAGGDASLRELFWGED